MTQYHAPAQKHRAGVDDVWQPRLRIFHVHNEVLRRVRVGKREGGGGVGHLRGEGEEGGQGVCARAKGAPTERTPSRCAVHPSTHTHTHTASLYLHYVHVNVHYTLSHGATHRDGVAVRERLARRFIARQRRALAVQLTADGSQVGAR